MDQDLTPAAKPSNADSYSTHELEPFAARMAGHGLKLRKDQTNTLQINVGLVCNQTCRHCHLEAGPNRSEIMSKKTMDEVVAYAERASFPVVDITGGAPEMNPDLDYLIENIAPVAPRLMLRANLTALAEGNTDHLLGLCVAHRVVIVASFPAVSASQTDAQRGRGVLDRSVAMLRRLNGLGYGMDGAGPELNLVSNPTGAFLPASQAQAEKRFRRDLERKWGLRFNNMFTFANSPLGRFRTWLADSGNLDSYMQKLSASFNPCTVESLMCRTLVSVDWEGYLYDCDFNLAKGVYLAGRKRHVSEMRRAPAPGTPIPTGSHCYACTAGSGFT